MIEIIVKELLNQREILVEQQKRHGLGHSVSLECARAIEKIDTEIQKTVDKQLLSDQNGFQVCPKCLGDGNLARHNSPQLSTTSTPICDVCNGKKIIHKLTGFPPQ